MSIALTKSYSFNLAVIDPCSSTRIIEAALNPMTFTLGSASSVVQEFFQLKDTIGQSLNLPELCRERKYELICDNSLVTLISPDDPWTSLFVLEVFTTNMSIQPGIHMAKLVVSLVNYI